MQFLSETLMLTLLGGILGISLGSFIPFMVQHFGKMPTVITGTSLVLAFGISAGVGVEVSDHPVPFRAAEQLEDVLVHHRLASGYRNSSMGLVIKDSILGNFGYNFFNRHGSSNRLNRFSWTCLCTFHTKITIHIVIHLIGPLKHRACFAAGFLFMSLASAFTACS